MKAAKNYTERWEAENWLRLIEATHRINHGISLLIKNILILVNLLLYALFNICKYTYLLTKLVLFTEPSIIRSERHETLIFRHYK